MKKHVYLVRHGETEQLAEHMRQTDESRLSIRGLQQAHACSMRFGEHGFHIDALMTSPLMRAQETAACIAERTGIIATILPEARERRLPSSFVGHSMRDAGDEEIKRIIFDLWIHAPGVRYADEETYVELQARVREVQRVLASSEAQRIALVTHGIFSKTFLAEVMHVAAHNAETFVSLYRTHEVAYTGISECTYTETDGWRLVTWNDHVHVQTLVREDDTRH